MILTKEKSDLLVILVGKLLQVVIMVISIKVLTTLLEPKDIGKIYIFTTIYTFFVLTFISPFGQYINRYTHEWYQKKMIFDNVSIYFIYLLLVSLFSIVMGIIIYYFGILNDISVDTFLLLLSLYVLFLTLNQTIIPILNMLHYRLSFTVLTVLTSFGLVFFGYVFVKVFGHSAQNWLFGTLLSNFFFLTIGYILLKNKLNENFHGFFYNFKRITKVKLKSILIFVIPLSVATLFMWLQNSGYRIIIEQNIGLEFLGFLGVGIAVSTQVASVVESIAMQYFHPIYYQKITNTTIEHRRKAIYELINKVLPIYFMLALFVTFTARYIVEILVDEKYYDVYIFTAFGIWIEFFRMTTNLFGNVSQSEMNTKKFMTPYIIGSVVTIILVLISSLSVEYKLFLPIALTIGGFFTMLMMYFSMKKLIDFKIDYKLIFYSFMISFPYLSIYFFNFDSNIYINLSVVISFGLYFLGTIYFIYKKGLLYANS